MTDHWEQHERLKMQLRLAGTSLAAVARELGIQPTTVSAVSLGKRRSHRIETAIATKLGTSPERIWPSRYGKSTAPAASAKRRGAMT